METKVTSPKTLVPFPHQHFAICDESRAIAAEYKGGLSSYPELKTELNSRGLSTDTPDLISTSNIETTALFISKDSSKKYGAHQGDKLCKTESEVRNVELNRPYAFVTLPNDSSFQNKLSYSSSISLNSVPLHKNMQKTHSGIMKENSTSNKASSLMHSNGNTIRSNIPTQPIAACHHEYRFPLVPFHNIPNPTKKIFNSCSIKSRYSYGNNMLSIPRSENTISDSLTHLAIKYYIKYHAVYIDYMTPIAIFQSIVPSLALSCPMLLQVASAIGAEAYNRIYPEQSLFQSEKYYDQANSLLFSELQKEDKDIETCILTATLITVYEVTKESNHDLKSHIAGVKTLLEEFPFSIDPSTKEIEFHSIIVQACFWVMIHCDLQSAFLLRSLPLWNPNEWGPAVGLKSNNTLKETTDDYAPHYWYSKTLYILYRIMSLRGLGYDPTLSSQIFSTRVYSFARQKLMDDLIQLQDDIPTIMRPMFEFAPFTTDEHSTPNQNANNNEIFSKTENERQESSELKDNQLKNNIPTRCGNIQENLLKSPSSKLNSKSSQEIGNDKCSIPKISNLFTKSSLHGVNSPFPFVYFSDPSYAITHAYIISGVLSLNSMKSGSIKDSRNSKGISTEKNESSSKTSFQGTGVIASPFDPFRMAISSEDCTKYARRLTGIITSTAPNSSIGCMTVWCFLYIAPYIHENFEREYILKYMEANCVNGWSYENIIAHVRNEWNKKTKSDFPIYATTV